MLGERLRRARVPLPRVPDVFPRGDLEVVLRDVEARLAAPDERDVLAAPEERGDLREADGRVDPVADFARDEAAVPEAARERDDVLRDDALARPAVERALVERALVERFAFEPVALGDLRDEEDALERRALLAVVEDEPELEESLGDHFPDITRCAASATASAMIEPNLVALETMLLAAWEAVSAASRPASRIFFRAAGLALIAAAAAARPAASISLLRAALASLSTVVSPDDAERDREPEELELEERLPADFAIAYLPPFRKRHFKAVSVPE